MYDRFLKLARDVRGSTRHRFVFSPPGFRRLIKEIGGDVSILDDADPSNDRMVLGQWDKGVSPPPYLGFDMAGNLVTILEFPFDVDPAAEAELALVAR